MKPRLILAVLIFSVFNLVGQAVASPADCLGTATNLEANSETPHCDEMRTKTESGKDGSSGCCGGDCSAMMQCSAISAIVTMAAAQADRHHRVLLHIPGASVIEPDGLKAVPEMRPPITT